jgi:hypothetical protein
MSTKTGARMADRSIQKVRRINSRLALAVTGTFMSDKLPFFANFVSANASEGELDAALDKLFDLAVATMRIHVSEGFRMSLIGMNADVPGFKCVDVENGKGFTALAEPGRNYWVSGENDPVKHAIRMIESSNVTNKPPATEIEKTLRDIVTDCIERYPQTLGMPVNVVVLEAA